MTTTQQAHELWAELAGFERLERPWALPIIEHALQNSKEEIIERAIRRLESLDRDERLVVNFRTFLTDVVRP